MMLYIPKAAKQRLDNQLKTILIGGRDELSYCISKLQIQFCEQMMTSSPITSDVLGDAISAATDAITEFYRRVVFPFEDHKRRENGDPFQEFIRKANI